MLARQRNRLGLEAGSAELNPPPIQPASHAAPKSRGERAPLGPLQLLPGRAAGGDTAGCRGAVAGPRAWALIQCFKQGAVLLMAIGLRLDWRSGVGVWVGGWVGGQAGGWVSGWVIPAVWGLFENEIP